MRHGAHGWFLLLHVACVSTCLGQSHIWSQRFGGVETERAWGIDADGDGNVFVTGYFEGTTDLGGGSLASAGIWDVFLAKYDAGGAHVWSRRFGAGGTDQGIAVAADPDGNVLVTGAYSGTVDFGGGPFTNAGFNDVFVAKYSATGAHLWSRHYGSTGNDTGLCIAVDTAGNVIVTGWFEESVDFGGGPVTSAGNRDVFLVKLGSDGAYMWSRGFGSADAAADIVRGIGVDVDGNICITGGFYGSADFGGAPLASAGSSDIFLAKYGPGGTHLWSTRLGATSIDSGRGVGFDGDGNVIVTGSFVGTVDFGGGPLESAGQHDVFVAKLDPGGTHIWSRRYGGDDADYGEDVAVAADGNILLTGTFRSIADLGGAPFSSAGSDDIFVAQYDPNGEHVWSRGFGDSSVDGADAVAMDGDGNALLTGFFNGSVDVGGGALMSDGLADLFVAKYETNLSAPAGSLPPASAGSQSDAVVRALLDDDNEIVSASLFYRGGGEAGFAELQMAEDTPGEWTATIPAVHVTERGIQYYVEAHDALYIGRVPASGVASLAVDLADHQLFDLPAGSYRLLGVPIAHADAGDPEAVFDELGPYDPATWRYGTYDGAEYREGTSAAPAQPGQGFWIISRESASIGVTGSSTDLSVDTAIQLHEGFNQIANPYFFPVSFADLELPAGVVANLIGYDGAGYTELEETLEPGRGYWIENASGAAQTLEIPSAPVAGGRVVASVVSPDEDGWSIAVSAFAGDRHDRANHFGVSPRAAEGHDVLDRTSPPNPPAGYVALDFLGQDGQRLSADYRNASGEGASWTLRLSSDLPHVPFRVAFDDVSSLPLGANLVAMSAYGEIVADLARDPVLRGALGESGGTRTWHVVAGPPSFVDGVADDLASRIETFRLAAARSPFGVTEGTVLTVFVPRPTPLDLRVYDIRGRLVRTLHSGSAPRGVVRAAWNGRDDAGRLVGAGTYFVRATAKGFETTQRLSFLR